MKLNIVDELQNLIVVQDSITWENTQGNEESERAKCLLETRNELMARIARYVSAIQMVAERLSEII